MLRKTEHGCRWGGGGGLRSSDAGGFGGKNWWMGGPLLHWRVWQLLKETEGLLQVRGKKQNQNEQRADKDCWKSKVSWGEKEKLWSCHLSSPGEFPMPLLHPTSTKKKKLRIFHAPPGGWLQCSRQSKIISQHYKRPGGSQVCVFFEAGPTQKQNFENFSR